jgi:hypothetical protein
MPVGDITGAMCAWRGCPHHFEGSVAPDDWWCLIAYVGDWPGSLDTLLWSGQLRRDAVLCPEHASALDQMLRPK